MAKSRPAAAGGGGRSCLDRTAASTVRSTRRLGLEASTRRPRSSPRRTQHGSNGDCGTALSVQGDTGAARSARSRLSGNFPGDRHADRDRHVPPGTRTPAPDRNRPGRTMTSASQTDDDRSKLLVHAYVDGELDPVNAIADRAADRRRILHSRRRPRASRRFAAHSAKNCRRPNASRPRSARSCRRRHRRDEHAPSWRAMAASIALAMVVSSGATWFVTRTPRPTISRAGRRWSFARFDGAAADRCRLGGRARRQAVVQRPDSAGPACRRLSSSGVQAGRRACRRCRTHRRADAGLSDPATPHQRDRHSRCGWTSRRMRPPQRFEATTSSDGPPTTFPIVAVSDLNAADLAKFAQAFRAPPASPKTEPNR